MSEPRKFRMRVNRTADGLVTMNLTRIPPSLALKVYRLVRDECTDANALWEDVYAPIFRDELSYPPQSVSANVTLRRTR